MTLPSFFWQLRHAIRKNFREALYSGYRTEEECQRLKAEFAQALHRLTHCFLTRLEFVRLRLIAEQSGLWLIKQVADNLITVAFKQQGLEKFS